MTLRVWYRVCSMSDGVAKKGMIHSHKQYTKKPGTRDFTNYTIEQATKELETEFGARPEKPVYVGHQFVEIISAKEI